VFVSWALAETKYSLGPLFPSVGTLLVYLTPMFLGVSIMTYVLKQDRDSLSQLQSREGALAASQERFEYLYMSSPVPYINIDGEGNVFMVNLAAVRLFDGTEKKILGVSLFEHIFHDNETKMSIILNQLQSHTALSDIEIQFKTLNGHTRWVLLSAFSYGTGQDQLVSLVDITRQKEIDIAKTEFVTLASHQLRTPIAAVRWNLELLRSLHAEPTAEQDLYYKKINRNVERLAGLVNDFLHVSKLELGTFASVPVVTELSAFIRNSLGEFDKMIEDKKLVIKTEFDPEPFKAELDTRLLRIVIDNLLSNAIKYTPNGGAITITYEANDQEISLKVSDTGIGIPIDEKENLFNRFYRASNAERQHTEGTGLGLYIARQAVRKMSGNISVDSVLGQGTTFNVKISL
jgi:PAS domain S-box-containing protein